ncbi:Pycsar system effector family protein [Streptomyces phaeofaciens]|uniref:Pycsar system effector family protein n=1 Tax=Streptomyces phaeofaciens TaxID=68254 RepID=UPI0036972EA2
MTGAPPPAPGTPLPPPASPAPVPTPAEALETAWRVHAALGEWTARVDTKASFALTLEAAALAAVTALASGGGLGLRTLPVVLLVVFVAGLLSLLGAICCAMLVVAPRTRGESTAAEAADNFVYFGHLRHWDPEGLRRALTTRDPLPMLSRQLVVMSRIAWRKHRWVELSFALSGLGGVLLCLALLLR